jgi:hypothetical protein
VIAIGAATAFAITLVACANGSRGTATGPGGGSCSSAPPSGPTPPAGQPDSLTIEGASAPTCDFSCSPGAGVPLLAVVTDVDGTKLTNQTVTWVSSNPSVASVVGRGLTTAGYVGSVDCLTVGSTSVSAVDQTLQASVTINSQ